MFASREEYVDHFLSKTAAPAADKMDFILEHVAGKIVLDIGCVDMSVEVIQRLGPGWLHGRICEVAKQVVGVDILEDAVAWLNDHGYHAVCADAMTLDLGQTFDVVVGADIIEHLPDPHALLCSAARHMHAQSECIVMTPNPFSSGQFLRILLGRNCGASEKHTCWIDPNVAWELVAWTPLVIKEFRWLRNAQWPIEAQGRWRRLGLILSRLMRSRRNMFHSDFGLVLTLK
jgi:2-polyprenyl-3-methyl-5-hydroxy-6-metoxy-1,4-benzoquinol methylase